MPSLIVPHHRPSPPSYDFDPRSSSSSLGSNDSAGSGSSLTSKPHGMRRFSGNNRSSGEFQRTTAVEKVVPKTACLDFTIESPPLVMYGAPKDSTVSPGCPHCSLRVSPLKEWDFLLPVSKTHTLKSGRHVYPFSFILPGHLPSSTDSTIGSIEYTLDAHAQSPSSSEPLFTAQHPLHVARSIAPPPNTPYRQSIRVFPPTALTATVHLPPVTHVGSSFPLEVRLDGVVGPTSRWRLRKTTWRIDETAKIVSPACSIHEFKLGGSGKGVLHEDVRPVASGEIKRGWKVDFNTAGGRIEMEIPSVGLPANTTTAAKDLHGHVSNDVESSAGVTVSHTLVLELIVAEESLPTKATKVVVPTGAARVLRMQFALAVTERAGMGISWDEEQPPMYGDVPASPPSYGHVVLEELDEEEFAALGL